MLRLRPYKKCDGEKVVSWIREEAAFYKWSAGILGAYPITARELNAYYEKQADSDSYYVMSAFDENGAVGQLIMRFLDEEKKKLRFGLVIVDASRRGMGYGKEMIHLALEFAFRMLGAKQVTIGVFANNPGAFHCYKSVGFKELGEEFNQIHHLMGEDWKCIELGMEASVWGEKKCM